MHDQAQVLRGLMEQRDEVSTLAFRESTLPARTLAVTSGKGGVGKSVVALNVGIALAEAGHSVCLLDGNLGLGNIDLLCGLNGYWNLAHVLSGARTLREITLQGPSGLQVIPGASGLIDVADCPLSAQQEVLRQLEELEYDHEFLIIDTGTGIHRAVRQFVSNADLGLVVTTPEPTAIADAYATIKAYSVTHPGLDLDVIVNRADNAAQARDILNRVQRTTQTFLHSEVTSAGFIPEDHHVVKSVRRQTPFRVLFPESPASRAVDQLARRLANMPHPQHSSHPLSFFTRLWPQVCQATA